MKPPKQERVSLLSTSTSPEPHQEIALSPSTMTTSSNKPNRKRTGEQSNPRAANKTVKLWQMVLVSDVTNLSLTSTETLSPTAILRTSSSVKLMSISCSMSSAGPSPTREKTHINPSLVKSSRLRPSSQLTMLIRPRRLLPMKKLPKPKRSQMPMLRVRLPPKRKKMTPPKSLSMMRPPKLLKKTLLLS